VCIEAMLGNREAALRYITELSRLNATYRITGHLDDYFRSLCDDPEFRDLIKARPERPHAHAEPNEAGHEVRHMTEVP
jgi:hypothetical protein